MDIDAASPYQMPRSNASAMAGAPSYYQPAPQPSSRREQAPSEIVVVTPVIESRRTASPWRTFWIVVLVIGAVAVVLYAVRRVLQTKDNLRAIEARLGQGSIGRRVLNIVDPDYLRKQPQGLPVAGAPLPVQRRDMDSTMSPSAHAMYDAAVAQSNAKDLWKQHNLEHVVPKLDTADCLAMFSMDKQTGKLVASRDIQSHLANLDSGAVRHKDSIAKDSLIIMVHRMDCTYCEESVPEFGKACEAVCTETTAKFHINKSNKHLSTLKFARLKASDVPEGFRPALYDMVPVYILYSARTSEVTVLQVSQPSNVKNEIVDLYRSLH